MTFSQEFQTTFLVTTYCLQVKRRSIGVIEVVFGDDCSAEDALSVPIFYNFAGSTVSDDADDFLADVRYVIALVIINEVECISYL